MTKEMEVTMSINFHVTGSLFAANVQLDHPAAVDPEAGSFVTDLCFKGIIVYCPQQPNAVLAVNRDFMVCHLRLTPRSRS